MAFTSSQLVCPACANPLSHSMRREHHLFCLGCHAAVVIEGDRCLYAWPHSKGQVWSCPLAALHPRPPALAVLIPKARPPQIDASAFCVQ